MKDIFNPVMTSDPSWDVMINSIKTYSKELGRNSLATYSVHRPFKGPVRAILDLICRCPFFFAVVRGEKLKDFRNSIKMRQFFLRFRLFSVLFLSQGNLNVID